jgi:hypothetical protein
MKSERYRLRVFGSIDPVKTILYVPSGELSVALVPINIVAKIKCVSESIGRDLPAFREVCLWLHGFKIKP